MQSTKMLLLPIFFAFLLVLRDHFVACAGNPVVGQNISNIGTDPNRIPIPRGFDINVKVLTERITLNYTQTLTLLVCTAARLGWTLPYEADMTIDDFTYPKDHPGITIRLQANPGNTLQVCHQLWALYACAFAFSDHGSVNPSICNFGLSPPYNLGFMLVAGSSMDEVNEDASNPALTEESSFNLTTRSSSEIPTSSLTHTIDDTNSSVISDPRFSVKIADFSTQALDMADFALDSIYFIISMAAYLAMKGPYPAKSTSHGINTILKWRPSDIAPRGSKPGWKEMIRALGSVYTYMSQMNKFFECSAANFLDDKPAVDIFIGRAAKDNMVSNSSS